MLNPRPVALPGIEGPIRVTPYSFPFNSARRQFRPLDPADFGYLEEEYFVSGIAAIYEWTGEIAVPTLYKGPYKTRILVRKPADAGVFSGNVIVELANWAKGYDISIAAWGEYFESILSRGDAWVQITIRPAVIERLKRFNLERYSQLSMKSPLPVELRSKEPPNSAYPYPPSSRESEDGLCWDIISQVGALFKSPLGENPLAGYRVQNLYATGATGGDLSAYVAAIHPQVLLENSKPVFDGYLIKMTGSPGPISQHAARIDSSDPRCQLHASVPVIRVLTQGDIFGFGEHPDWGYKQRRPDSDILSDRFRLYETAGPTVGSKYPLLSGPNQADVEATGEKWEGDIKVPACEFPLRYILNGAMVNLDKWVRQGIAPPRADRLKIINTGLPEADFGYDQNHNVQGGVRTPYVDVPVAVYPRMGAPVPFTRQLLADLYKDHQEYVNRVIRSVQQLAGEGWVTDTDARRIIAEAKTADIP